MQQRIAHEHVEIERVRNDLASRWAVVPWATEPPIGEAGLLALLR